MNNISTSSRGLTLPRRAFLFLFVKMPKFILIPQMINKYEKSESELTYQQLVEMNTAGSIAW